MDTDKAEARKAYYQAKERARTACGSCRSLRCPYCQEMLRLWYIYLALALR